MSLIDEFRLYTDNPSVKVSDFYRPSEFRGRSPKFITFDRISLTPAGTVIYTVAPGFNLYISSFFISALNTATADGQFLLRDDTGLRVPFLSPSRVSGSSPSSLSLATPALPEPLLFSTNVNLIEITGVIEVSGVLIGYEEPIGAV